MSIQRRYIVGIDTEEGDLTGERLEIIRFPDDAVEIECVGRAEQTGGNEDSIRLALTPQNFDELWAIVNAIKSGRDTDLPDAAHASE